MADSIPDEVKSERLRILMDRQREIQREHYGRHLGQVQECMVESYNTVRGQVVGRSSQNKDGELYEPRRLRRHSRRWGVMCRFGLTQTAAELSGWRGRWRTRRRLRLLCRCRVFRNLWC